ncbi:MAG: hypothetical protein ABWZ26_03500 [Candidatus Nanopelagicales bacterium]
MRTRHGVAVVAAGILAATLVPISAQAVGDGAGLDDTPTAMDFGTSGTSDGSSSGDIFEVTPICADPGLTDLTITVPSGPTGPFRVLDAGQLNGGGVLTELDIIPASGPGPQDLTVNAELEAGPNWFIVQRPQSSPEPDPDPGNGGVDLVAFQSATSTTILAADEWQIIGYAAVGAPCPAISVTPNPLDRGTVPTELTLELTGFPSSYDAVLRIEEAKFAAVTTDKKGRATWVQEVRYPPPCGAYDIGAAVEVEPPPLPHTAATVLNVLCPTLSADPTSLPHDTLPGSTTLTGGGWAADTDVSIAWDTGSLVAHTDKSGRLNATMPIDERDCGPIPVTATEAPLATAGLTLNSGQLSSSGTVAPTAINRSPQTASTTVTITCVDPPTLLVSPAVTGPGSVTQAVGTRLPAGADVLLVWTDATGRPMPGVTRAVVGADGVMRAPVLVLPRSATGPRQLVLLDAAAPGSPAVVAAPALIVNNSVEPGRDRLLTRR